MSKPLGLVAVLCLTALLPARTGDPKPGPDYSQFQKKLGGDQQILQVLDRLTFGPRPGDVGAVKKLGLKKWIDLQLHPDQIAENRELEKRLQPLESLRMNQAETVAEYPTQQVIRAVALGKQPLPDDPVARQAVEKQVQRLDAKQDIPDGTPLVPKVPLTDLLTPAQVRIVRSGTLEDRRALLASIPSTKIDDFVVAVPNNDLRNQLLPSAAPELRRKLMLANNPQQVVAADLSEGKLFRAIYSNRQLEEVLVDFWFNHFNVFLDKGNDRFMVPTYERESIRPNVLGKFRDLLEATATSPAMMFYLDNFQSVAPQPPPAPNAKQAKQTKQATKQNVRGLNENYARELMELHTLGVDGGYTQKDVTEVARCFTGWSINQPKDGSGFVFNDKNHDKGEKTVLGVTIPAGGGKEDGEKVLDILAHHPSTARFISKELAQRFVADDPPPMLLDRMAQTFHDTDGDIRAVLTTLFNSQEFFSQGAYHAKVKSPFEMIVSAVRATGARVDYALPLANQISTWGEPLYRKVEPTGYSNVGAEWINSSALIARMNFAMQLGQNKVQGLQLDPKKFSAKPDVTAKEVLFTNASSQTLTAINKTLSQDKKKNAKQAPNPGLIAGLVIGSPDFQRR